MFLKRYEEDPDDLVIWDKATEAKIKNLGYKFSDLISLAKNSKNSCFKKQSYPSFNRKILDYYDFKTRWSMEVMLERQLELHKLINSISWLVISCMRPKSCLRCGRSSMISMDMRPRSDPSSKDSCSPSS